MDEDTDEDLPGPSRKRKRLPADPDNLVEGTQTVKGKGCIIHHESVKNSVDLISPKDLKSWSTLLKAAEIRQYTPLTGLASGLKEQEVPDIQYHRDCRSLFTMKRDLQSISKESKETVRDSPSKFKSYTRRSSVPELSKITGTSRVYGEICIFCEKTTKYKKGTRSKEELKKCVELRGDQAIRKAASLKKDQKILALTSRELVAAEGQYHWSCYKNFTACLYRDSEQKEKETEAVTDDHARSYDDKESESYSSLFDEMRKDLFQRHSVVRMSKLMEKHVHTLKSKGVSEIKRSTQTHFRRKLETEFGSSLSIFPDRNGRLLVMPDNVTIYDLAKENQLLVKEIEELKQKDMTDSDMIVKKAAQVLRADLKEKEKESKWPPSVDDLESYEINSYMVKTFLTILLTGEAKPSDPSERIKRLVNSFAQDFIYAISVGSIKTPKHVLLPFAVKSLTGNAELIRILNRLGHGVSYTQVEEIDTALCLQKLARAESEGIALPSNIKPHVQTTLAWDNIDRLEETLTGEGTSHRVNGIAVQAKVFGPEQKKEDISMSKVRRRTIESVVEELPVYNTGERVGPPVTEVEEVEYFGITKQAWLKNLAWILTRQVDFTNQTVCSWTGFNILTRSATLVLQDSVGYLPTVNFPATDMSTVFEVLNRSSAIMKSLQLNSIICVFDQALYAKAAEIVWKHADRFSGIVLRLGTFHTICTLLGIIGKRFQDAGLKDLCVESGIVASGSVAGVMEGRKYNRAIRVHKLCYEALMRIAWKRFLSWTESEHEDVLADVNRANECISKLKDEQSEENMEFVMHDECFTKVSELFCEFLQHLRNGNGSLSTFWMSYIDIVEILLNMIRASREGDWQLHLASVRSLIPWCFAYDRLNYARYLPVYYSDMMSMETKNPDIHSYLSNGGFSVQLGSDNPFGRIPVDQTIEETINKDTQTAGGTKGFSLKPGTVSRYYITAEYRSAFLRYLRQMLSLDDSGISHSDLTKPRIEKDEADIISVIDILESTWVNPFGTEKFDIVSLSTAAAAPANVEHDLLNANAVGEKEYEKFKAQRLEVNPPIVKFHDRIPKQNLKTLSEVKKKKKVVNVSGKELILRADKNLFGNMLMIAQGRKLKMEEVLCHPLGPVPWTLANTDGSLRKTSKAELKRSLEKNATPAENFDKPACCVIDGMALIQKVNGDRKTFDEIADQTLSSALREGFECQRIDVVFDVYRDVTIKQNEREKRAADGATQFKNIAPGHRVQQWRPFLAGSNNKSSLIKFFVTHWSKPAQRQKLGEKTLYVTCEEKCHKLNREGASIQEELNSIQEEADTRLLLHASHASRSGNKSIVIVSEDTDVFLLCLAFGAEMSAKLYLKCGTKNRIRFIEVQKLVNAIGKDVSNALIGMHAFTGCDTVSAFYGKGKAKALKLVTANTVYQNVFKELGREWDLSEDIFNFLEAFTCDMYDQIKCGEKTVNQLRYRIFVAKRGEADSSQLPPCKDCLINHARRANYQAGIWRRCLENNPDIPFPIDHGWLMDEPGVLSVEWMSGPVAPDDVLEMLSCKCSKQCKLPECACLRNRMKCTYMCKLQTCTNQASDEFPEYVDESEALDGDLFEVDDIDMD